MADKQDENPQAAKPDVESTVEESIGGVQGEQPDPAQTSGAPEATGASPEETPPDSGEIEWARQVVKRPPAPEN